MSKPFRFVVMDLVIFLEMALLIGWEVYDSLMSYCVFNDCTNLILMIMGNL